MQRLSGVDSMFLYMETPTNQMHVAGVFLVDPASAPGGFSFAKVHDMVAGRLGRAAPFRRRVVDVPFRIAHPVWIEDPNFDLDYHVRRACLPSPGGRASSRTSSATWSDCPWIASVLFGSCSSWRA